MKYFQAKDYPDRVTKCDGCDNKVQCEWTCWPYNAELHGDYTKYWICEDCLAESISDI